MQNLGGRPEKPIDWNVVDDLLLADCLGTEIASHFNIHPQTFYRKIEEKYGIGFTAYAQEIKQRGDSIIRKAQFDKAVIDRDNTMLIWLGKMRLGQKDPDKQQAQNTPQNITFKVNYPNGNSIEILPENVSDSAPTSP